MGQLASRTIEARNARSDAIDVASLILVESCVALHVAWHEAGRAIHVRHRTSVLAATRSDDCERRTEAIDVAHFVSA
jgi:hypothetical protein